jgi:hypothetical protein
MKNAVILNKCRAVRQFGQNSEKVLGQWSVRHVLFSEPAKLLWMMMMMMMMMMIIIIIIISNVKLNSKKLKKMRVWKYSFKYPDKGDGSHSYFWKFIAGWSLRYSVGKKLSGEVIFLTLPGITTSRTVGTSVLISASL